MTDPRRIPETKGDGFEIRPRRQGRCQRSFVAYWIPAFEGMTRLSPCQARGGLCGCIALLSAALACCIGFLAMTIRPALAEPDPGPINVIRAEPGADRDGQLQGAYRAYRAGDLDAARSGYAEVLDAYPDNRDAMLGLAACAVREGDLRSAVDMYRRITRAYPQDAPARAALAGLQGSREGEPVIRELLARQPDNPFLHLALGRLLAERARWPEARRAFAAARRLEPANPVHVLNLAISLDRMGQREEALNYYRATLKLVEQSASGLDVRPVVRRINTLRRP